MLFFIFYFYIFFETFFWTFFKIFYSSELFENFWKLFANFLYIF